MDAAGLKGMDAPNEVIHQPVRLRVMAALAACDPADEGLDFRRLKSLTGLILAGYFWSGEWFNLWLAIVNGGGFVLCGLWMRRA